MNWLDVVQGILTLGALIVFYKWGHHNGWEDGYITYAKAWEAHDMQMEPINNRAKVIAYNRGWNRGNRYGQKVANMRQEYDLRDDRMQG